MLQLKEYELRSILKDFYTLTHIRIVVLDTDMQEVLSYPEERFAFCAILRQDPRMNAKCIAGDLRACRQCAGTKDIVSYRCHAGLTETVVPIVDKLGVIGYLMFGQVLPSEDAENRKAQILSRYREEAYPGIVRATGEIPQITDAEITAAATILQSLTAFVHSSHLVAPMKDTFLRQLDDYIAANLAFSITAQDICREFGISRSRLYGLCHEYLGTGIAQYIRSARIEKAKELLLSTDIGITEIANATGFADYTHFSRVFREAVKCSAREYRKRYA